MARRMSIEASEILASVQAWWIVRAPSESDRVTELNGPLYWIVIFTYASSFELQNKSKFSLKKLH
jgi:hypothetical protein